MRVLFVGTESGRAAPNERWSPPRYKTVQINTYNCSTRFGPFEAHRALENTQPHLRHTSVCNRCVVIAYLYKYMCAQLENGNNGWTDHACVRAALGAKRLKCVRDERRILPDAARDWNILSRVVMCVRD